MYGGSLVIALHWPGVPIYAPELISTFFLFLFLFFWCGGNTEKAPPVKRRDRERGRGVSCAGDIDNWDVLSVLPFNS